MNKSEGLAERWKSREEVISQMKNEILDCIKEGYIPKSVKSFSELHDYIDANDLGGFCDDDCPIDHGSEEDALFFNSCQDAIDVWLRSKEFKGCLNG